MKKASRLFGLFLALIIAAVSVNILPLTAAETEKIVTTESSGDCEQAYFCWEKLEGAEGYTAYCKPVGGSYTQLDNELIREYADYYRADITCLSPGEYVLKAVPIMGGEENESLSAETEALTVISYVREGFAFSSNSPNGTTTGACNSDGTLAENADIIYVTNDNKDSLTFNGYTGLYNILEARNSAKSETPLIVRFIGKVEMPTGVEDYMLRFQNLKNVTIEGIGDDATLHGYGMTFKRCQNFEIRNIGIMWYGGEGGDGDSLSLDTENKNFFIHNIDFFYGAPGGDSDQAKGDGSIDLKARSDYITISYNHFWDSGKALVSGGVYEAKNPDNEDAKIFTTFHHNWFDHSDSRHPRCVAGSTHVYNNYYDGVAKYGVGAAVQSSVFVENNYFRNCPRPMIIATQGSDVYQSDGTYADKGTLSGQTGGMIKEYGNYITGETRFVNQNTTPDEGQIDAYSVTSRDEQVPDTVAAVSGGSTYNNFDTDESIMYSYNVETAEDCVETVKANAGRLNGGDFSFEFSESEDTNSDVIPELRDAIVNYESAVVSIGGIASEEEETTTEATTETTTESSDPTSETTTESADPSSETTTEGSVVTASSVWTADMTVPSWLTLTGYSITGNSSSHTVFADIDEDVAALSSRYTADSGSTIDIALTSAATVKVYICGNNNSAGKGTVTASGAASASYTLPGRKDSTAEPFTIEVSKAGTLTLTNSYSALLYKIEIITEGSSEPAPAEEYSVTLNITNTTAAAAVISIGENTIETEANSSSSTVLSLEAGTYAIAAADKTLKANPSEITVSGDEEFDITIEQADENVIVNSAEGAYIGGYETITDALAADSTVDGCIIYVTPGKYNEGFDVSKSVVLEKLPDSDGEVIVYGAGGDYGGSMDGVVQVSASNVTVRNITFLNNINASYGDIEAQTTKATTAAALISDGDNSVFESCKFISVQDTVNIYHYSSGKPLLAQSFNNCTFYGATDFICGSSIVDFNDCEFRIYTGSLTEKEDTYIFAPSQNAQWTVNGGKVTFDEANISQNFYYGRPWEDRSDNSQTLNIYGLEHDVTLGTKGLMGFGGPTGGGRSHSVNDFSFNVYAGSDSSSELIATSNVTALELFEMNSDTPAIELNSNGKLLLVGDFGKGMGSRFIANILPDIIEVGFVSEANASADKISDENTIKAVTLYGKISTEAEGAYSLKSVPAAEEGVYFGAGLVEEISQTGSISVVPYIKYDAVHNSDTIDIDPIYKFGTAVTITVSSAGTAGETTSSSADSHYAQLSEEALFGTALPDGVGVNLLANVFDITSSGDDDKDPDEDEGIYGDADSNGALTANDAAIVLAGVIDPDFEIPAAFKYVDVNEDEIITAADAALILAKVLDVSVDFPAEK